jgi:hypothetical protein
VSSYQVRVAVWATHCFGEQVAYDKGIRNYRFLEEALELVQAGGCTKEEALKLVDYVYGRPVGDLRQEVGGVMVTLAALCSAQNISVVNAAEKELERCWLLVEKIRQKQASKPHNSPLPE